jgi:uncharacterized membrane protein YcaP (DUF421 family)
MDLVLRAAVLYLFVFALTRLIGKRELGSLEPFDLILLVVTGDLIQQGVTQNDYSVTGALLVVSTIGLLTVLISYLNFRLPPLRRVLEGEPMVIVRHGRVIEGNLRRERITVAEVEEKARQQQVASLDEVDLGVLESDGQMSFIPRKGPAASQ